MTLIRFIQEQLRCQELMSHQRNGVLRAITERANERRISLSNFNKPIGVNGPIANQAGMSFWSKGYSANGTASADSNIEGYDLSGAGTIFGLDYAAKKYVAGIAAGMTSQTMKMDSSESTQDPEHILQDICLMGLMDGSLNQVLL